MQIQKDYFESKKFTIRKQLKTGDTVIDKKEPQKMVHAECRLL